MDHTRKLLLLIHKILLYLKKGDFLFIDEIHGLKKNVEELLYSAMEDFTVYNMLWRQEKEKKEHYKVSINKLNCEHLMAGKGSAYYQ